MLNSRRRRTIGAAVAIGTLATGGIAAQVHADTTNPASPITVNCDADITADGVPEDGVDPGNLDIAHELSGPDQVETGASLEIVAAAGEVTLPAENPGSSTPIDSYDDVTKNVNFAGMTDVTAEITQAGDFPSTVTVDEAAGLITVVVHNDDDTVPPGDTWTTPEVTITGTASAAVGEAVEVTAPEGAAAFDTETPFYRATATAGGGAITADVRCQALDDTQRANAELSVPVAEPAPDTTAPEITITSPSDGEQIEFGADEMFEFECSDAESEVAACDGAIGDVTVAPGDAVDTSAAGDQTLMVTASDSEGNEATASATFTVLEEGVEAPDPVYEPLAPARYLDTRADGTTFDGENVGDGAITSTVYELPVAGRGDVPADAQSVVLNVTATNTQGPGFVTAYPCGDQPATSNLNYVLEGDSRPNAVISGVDADGNVCLVTGGAASDVIVDVNGYFPEGAGYESAASPQRIEDGVAIAADETIEVEVPGAPSAAAFNITAAGTQGPGFLSVYPCGGDQPDTSSVNYSAEGEVVPNSAISALSDDGKLCITAGVNGADRVIVDYFGAFTDDAQFEAIAPARVTPERLTPAAGEAVEVDVSSAITADARAVVMNVTGAESTGPGFVTVWSCDGDAPTASSVNYAAEGQTRPNMVISEVQDGTICLQIGGATAGLLVDVTGYFPAIAE